MTTPIPDPHVYLRTVDLNERTSLSVLAGHVRAQAHILDLGCGSGALGAFLAEHKQCVCDGVTLSQEEARHAAPFYRHVHVADLEDCDLDQLFGEARYDYIVCADVLEHLRQPERILAACRKRLTPEGRLLISVPNAGYSGLVAELLHGEFRYREEGLLDRTHLRFFTRRSLSRFLAEQGWQVDDIDTIERALPESEFRVAYDSLPPAVARHLLATPDALAYQFIASAAPVAQAQAIEPPVNYPQAHALFTAQLYMARAGRYDEESKLSTTGIIGQARQTLRFALPDHNTSLSHLRLDLADRPGFIHLHRLALLDAQGAVVWQWLPEDSDAALLGQRPHHQLVWNGLHPAGAFSLMLLLTGDDPWFELPIPAETLAALRGASLEIEMGWPMSADYLALAGAVQPLERQIAQERSRANDLQDQWHTQRMRLEQQHAQDVQQLEERSAAIHRLQHRNALLEDSHQSQSKERAIWQQEATRVQRDFARLEQHLRDIENSTVFRATRPLVHAKMRIDRLLGRTSVPAPVLHTPVPQPMPQQPVDVIVPVYRGLDDTRNCIESVLASPCRTHWQLVVINDASPEPEVTAWLREKAAQEPRITLLENEENLGFVGTVNRGMALNTAHDVLLLNSDTVVANDWLDRIRQAAYGDARIASVTPFSNNATICSYPRFCEGNDLPPGMDTAAIDALCARTNPGQVVDVPTGVGFCMYIRRDSLTAVGLFDTEHFGKGYGEENDFCQRAAAAGWRNLHLLDTFVLHTGGVSFGESKSPRERAAMETLRRLHPRYEADVMAFVQADPARTARLALDVARLQAEAAQQPVVLAVLHDRAGGTVRHVRELAQFLQGKALFLMLSPAAGGVVVLRRAEEKEAFELAFRINDQMEELVQALRQLGVVHVHYQHLLGHSEAILDLPARLGTAHDFTAHDFYTYCKNISLTGIDNRYIVPPRAGECGCCEPTDTAPYAGTVAQWRHRNALLLNNARHVLAPSQDTASRIAGFVPGARVQAVAHTDMPAQLPTPTARTLAATAPLKIVVLGAMSAIKGADVLEAVAIEAAKRGAPVEFHLLGYGYRSLQTQPRARLTVHGGYKEEELPALLEWLQPDLAWFPAQWPETYSYTLSACLAAGLPIVAPDIGAFPERLAGRDWSWVMPWDASTAQWLDFFAQIRERHFIEGQLPQQPAATGSAAAQPGAAFYGDGYLQGLQPRDQALLQPLDAALLATHRLQRQDHAARSGALILLAHLRSLPILRGVARRIPAHWQRRVKNWLQA
ncbi:methyltransferase domain-containing protein [Delftia tsuruhatensis]|uniref:methyltransferase domain-containing protein n=1 Tax=Delftia tsuruhatensis TaxID=180282 RepID=UPI002443A9B1|nr:methyltransferase domain-containing protein [Delftia tsuruhatensis]MDH0772203.1 methyltransferase domain-containing protein [Delftia tsuruhatensis]MDH1456277.1 methyltransferase domain-containing protein [Delftia tsuruhatensis]MDH1825171.1 methyltransferase domain-containing protein [Delftia tsuruhatensis]WGG10346.1 methyltransferase domain-containing protein [Delftia tsuruhatensis]